MLSTILAVCLVLLQRALPWPLNETRRLYETGHSDAYNYLIIINNYLPTTWLVVLVKEKHSCIQEYLLDFAGN